MRQNIFHIFTHFNWLNSVLPRFLLNTHPLRWFELNLSKTNYLVSFSNGLKRILIYKTTLSILVKIQKVSSNLENTRVLEVLVYHSPCVLPPLVLAPLAFMFFFKDIKTSSLAHLLPSLSMSYLFLRLPYSKTFLYFLSKYLLWPDFW